MESTLDGPGTSPLTAAAPVLIREALVYPYRDGLRFTFELFKAGGKQKAFNGALATPPTSTHEILSPQAYLQQQSVPPLELPDLKKAVGKAYLTYDVGSIGQFDVEAIAKQFADKATAKRIGPAWRGGIYWALNLKGTQPTKTGDLGIVFLSRWATSEKAEDFALLYSGATTKRFTNAEAAKRYHWHTEEGDVSTEVIGSSVLVMESLPPDVAARVRSLVVRSLESPTTKAAKVYPELSPRLMPALAAIQRLIFPDIVEGAVVATKSTHAAVDAQR
jgi:hypothetical protein